VIRGGDRERTRARLNHMLALQQDREMKGVQMNKTTFGVDGNLIPYFSTALRCGSQ
jgi:hypothetical protein